MTPWEMPPEPYETEVRPKRSPAPVKGRATKPRVNTSHSKIRSKPPLSSYKPNPALGKSNAWDSLSPFWKSFLIVAGIPYAIFLLLAFIGGFLR